MTDTNAGALLNALRQWQYDMRIEEPARRLFGQAADEITALRQAASQGSAGGERYDNAAFQNTDDAEIVTILAAVRHCANSWDGSARLLGNVRARDISRACNAAIAALSPPVKTGGA